MSRILKSALLCAATAALVLSLPSAGHAYLVAGQDIIPAPASVIDDAPGAENTAQQAFDERQNITLSFNLNVDGGSIPTGTVVSSHMIFLNTAGGGQTVDSNVTWTFDAPILGVMSDTNGNLEAASNALLGASGTTYPGAFQARGLEPNSLDGYSVSGNQITVTMQVTEPGDWIRVITRGGQLSLDIHPTSCPNPLSVRKQGLIPAAIAGTSFLDVNDIDPSSLLLEGVPPHRYNYDDVTTPFYGEECECHEEGADAYTDLTLKFRAPDVLAALGDVMPGDVVTLTLTGNLRDGTPFTAQDCMVIRGNIKSHPDDPSGDNPGGDAGGAPVAGASSEEPVRKTTWGQVKARYGGDN